MKKILFTTLLFAATVLNAQQLQTFCQCNSGSYVRAMAHDKTNGIVYLGGNFTSMCSTSRIRLAAVSASTGSLVSTFTPPFVNGDIYAMAYSKNHLYIAGNFTTVGGQPRNYLACINTITNAVTAWNPSSDFTVLSLAAYKNKVIIGGMFSSVGGAARKSLAEVDTVTGIATAWQPDAQGGSNPRVEALCVSGDTLYAGGSFTIIGSGGRNNAAAFDMTTGNMLGWDPSVNGEVYWMDNSAGSVFIGGSITGAGSVTNDGIVKVDRDLGTADGSWLPTLTYFGSAGAVTAIHVNGSRVYIGGAFDKVGGTTTNRLVALDTITGALENFVPNVVCNNGTGLQVSAITSTPNKLIFTGDLVSVLGTTKAGSAAVCINPIDVLSSIDASATTVCNGITGVSYSVAPVAGATSYTWTYSGAGATIHGTTNTITIDFSNSATGGTLTVSGTNGCEFSNTQTVSIDTYSFTTSVNANSNSITCGDSVDINSSDNYNGSGTITFSWAPSTGLNATNVYKVTSGTKATRTYTLTETSSEGCVAKDFTTITVAPFNLNTSDYYTSGILCSTKDTLYVTNDYPGFGTVTYTWSPSASLNLPHAAKATASPVVSTGYTITASASDGCTATTQSVFVTVDPISLNTGSTLNSITCGDATQLSATNNYPGLGVLTYTWAPSTALSNTHITNPTANPIASTDYTLTLHSPEGCVSTNDAFINVDALQINLSSSVTANCHAPTTLSANANSTNAGLTYTWTPATGLNNSHVASPVAVVGQNTSYNVTMALPSTGCASANNAITINIANPNGLQLCMVTVDSASTHNIVYWDKTGLAGAAIDSFRIYREITTNVYGIVGTVHYNALSEFHDFAANPNVTTYRYKISALDSCGLESPLSLYHNTVYIINVGNGQYTWNPGYTIESTTNPVNNYLLMRDNINNGTWIQVASTSGSQNTIADPAWASFPLANWQVVTAWSISCSPTARQSNGTQSAIVKSKSNISNNRPTGIKTPESNFSVYPNPTNGNLTINFTNIAQGKVNVKVLSAIGQEVYNETFIQTTEKHNVDLSKYENGIYLVQITTNNTTVIKRIVKN